MSGISLAAAAVLAGFNHFPGFEPGEGQVEAIIDKGPVAEVIVRCDKGTGIIAVSKPERTFCTPTWRCFRDFDDAIAETCK